MSDIFPEFDQQVSRVEKEVLLGQQGKVFWLCGLSGSGKSTVANVVERKLHEEGRYIVRLDGDNIRSGLNAGLGFSEEDREENIRRVSEVAKLFKDSGAIVLVTLITPQDKFRMMAREIIGLEDFCEVYIKASYEACEERDVKGLYAKAASGGVKNFTGKSSGFEEPEHADLVIDTEMSTIDESSEILLNAIR